MVPYQGADLGPLDVADALDDPFPRMAPAPIARGIDAVSSWAAYVLGVAVAALTAGINPKAVLIARGVKALGRLNGKAVRSEKALRLRHERLGDAYDLTLPDCPTDDLARHAWAYARLAGVISELAAEPVFDEVVAQRYVMLFDALAAYKEVVVDHAFSGLKQQLNGGD